MTFAEKYARLKGLSETPNRRINMSLTSHLAELRRKHGQLSEKIEFEQRSPSADDLSITEMKKEKLQLKQEIERIAAR